MEDKNKPLREKDFLTTGKVAELVGVSKSTLQEWAKSGKIKSTYVNGLGHRYWTEEDVVKVRAYKKSLKKPKEVIK